MHSTVLHTGPVGSHGTANIWIRSVSADNSRTSPADLDDGVLTSQLVHLLRPPLASADSPGGKAPSLRAMSFALGFKNLKILSRHWYFVEHFKTRFLYNRTLSVDMIWYCTVRGLDPIKNVTSYHSLTTKQKAVLRIREILLRILMRIRILGSVPLTNGSGRGSGSVPKYSVTFRMHENFFLHIF
jgi:hypothetical protein